MAAADAEAEEIRLLAKTYQYDRYVSALLAPRRYREALIILAAFGAELQRIPLLVTEPMMAAIRLQWWRDELSAAVHARHGGRRIGHRLFDALVETTTANRLPVGLLQGMIDAAETELDPKPFNDSAETRQVLIKFDGALFELAGRLLESSASRDVWLLAAQAYGNARLAHEAAWRQKSGAQTYLAADRPAAKVEAAEHFASDARDALAKLRLLRRDLDRGALRALLPLAAIQPFLRSAAMSLQQSDGITAPPSDFSRARRILWAHWRGPI